MYTQTTHVCMPDTESKEKRIQLRIENELLNAMDEAMASMGFTNRSEYIRQSVRESIYHPSPRSTAGSQLRHVMANHDKASIDDNVRERLVLNGQVFFHGDRNFVGKTTSRDVVLKRLRKSNYSKDETKHDAPVSLGNMAKLRRDGGLVYLAANLSLQDVDFGRIVYIEPGTEIKFEEVDDGSGDSVWIKKMQGKYAVDVLNSELPGQPGQYTVHKLHNDNKIRVIESYREQWAADEDPQAVRMPWE